MKRSRKKGQIQEKQSHDKTLAHSSTSVSTKSSLKQQSRYEVTKLCDFHTDETLEFYCESHNTVSCSLCVASIHQKCETIVSLADAAPKALKGSSIEKLERKLMILYEFCQKRKFVTKENLQQIKTEKQDIVGKIAKLKEDIKKKIDQLGDDLIKQLDNVYKECYVSLAEDIDMYQEKKDKVRSYQKQLIADQDNSSKVDLFCSLKLLEAKCNEHEDELHRIDRTTITLCFEPAECCTRFDKIVNSFAEIRAIRTVSVDPMSINLYKGVQTVTCSRTSMLQNKTVLQKLSSIDISTRGLKISGGCFIDGERLLLCAVEKPVIYGCCFDGSNFKSMELKYSPLAITSFDSKQAVVSLGGSGKIQFIDVLQHTPSHRYNIGGNCAGITSRNGIIWVGMPKAITTIDLKDKTPRQIKTEFTAWDICVNHREDVFSTELVGNSIRVIRKTSGYFTDEVFFEFGSTDERHIAADEAGNLYVSENFGNTIYKIDGSGKHVKLVLEKRDGINQPRGIAYDSRSRHLMVINNNGSSILIYSAK